MEFLTGAELAQKLKQLRLSNGMSALMSGFRGIGQKSSLRRKRQNGFVAGSGEQECYRRRIGGFYAERKRDAFP